MIRRIWVQEAVDVVVFRGVGGVCEAAVAGEQDYEEEEVDPGAGVYACEDQLEEAEDGVERVL